MALKISIVTPDRDVLNVECDEVVVPGANGELGLLPQHVPLISALKPGVLTLIRDSKRRHYVLSTGFVEIDGEQITILTGTCEAASEVDVPRARKAFDGAQALLEKLGPDDPGYHEAQMRLRRAGARMDGAARAS